MLPPETIRAIENAARDLDDRQVAWMSGYLAGLRSSASAHSPSASSVVLPEGSAVVAGGLQEGEGGEGVPSATILYGSQSGNAKSAAVALAERIRKGGGAAEVFDMARYKTAALKREKLLFVVVSTQGEGEPPDSARRFYDFLHGGRAPSLEGARFATLALGDSGYEHFCKTGRDMDKRLAELGAKRIAPVVECDVDFEDAAAEWRERVVGEISRRPRVNGVASPSDSAVSVSGELHEWSRQNPFTAEVIANVRLTGEDPDKRVHHLEFSLEGSGMAFSPGDSLGVWPENPDGLVAEALDTLGATGDDVVEVRGERGKLLDWLSRRLELSPLSPAVVARWAGLKGADDLAGRESAAEFARGRTAADLFRRVPARGDVGGALGALRKMSPRLYSLASSHGAREGEAHLVVSVCRYLDSRGRMQNGLSSGFLSGLSVGNTARVFVHENEHFRLPESDEGAAIMIGPGTGVAPFRAFMEEREFRGSRGANWLFFGERNRREHFLYQTEFQQWVADGLLTRLDAAFSRDGAAKVYVQHKMLARAAEFWKWVREGASVYVCGDEKRMAKDVDAALRRIAEEQGGMSAEGAAEFWAELRDAGRYQRDVY